MTFTDDDLERLKDITQKTYPSHEDGRWIKEMNLNALLARLETAEALLVSLTEFLHNFITNYPYISELRLNSARKLLEKTHTRHKAMGR